MSLTFDLRDFQRYARRMDALANQIPFALAVALNASAEVARKHIVEDTWPEHVQARNRRFLAAALTTKGERATKRRLRVIVYDRLGRASLRLHEVGGTKKPRGAALAVPSAALKARRTGKGVPKGLRPRSVPNSFKGVGKFGAGVIYQRTGTYTKATPTSKAVDNLVAGQGDPSAAAVAELQEGRNILRATIKLEDTGIYSAINFHGQQPGQGDDYTDRTAQGTATNPDAKTTRIRVEHAEHTGDADDMTTRANIEAARSGWDQVEATVTVAGWFRPDGLLWGLTDNISIYSPMGFPNGTGKMTLGVQSVLYSQVKDDEGEGTTTTMTLVRPQFLSSTPFANVASDGSGGYGPAGSTPASAAPVAPDYSQGSLGPGGQLGHA